MTTEDANPDREDAMAKLLALAEQRKGGGHKGGSVPQHLLEEWTSLFVATVTADPDALNTVIAMPGLPPRVVGAGVARLWHNLDLPTRTKALRAMPKDSDRGSPMRLALASELIAVDPATAAEELAELPRSKENVARVGKLLREQPTQVAGLVAASPTRRKAASLLTLLLGEARASETGLPARLEVAGSALAWLRKEGAPDFGPDSIGDSLVALIELVDPRVRSSFEPDLANIPSLWVRVFPDRPLPTKREGHTEIPEASVPSTSASPTAVLLAAELSSHTSEAPRPAAKEPIDRPGTPAASTLLRTGPAAAPVSPGGAVARPAQGVPDASVQLSQLDSWIDQIDNQARLLRACRVLVASAERQKTGLTTELAVWRNRASQHADKLEALEKRLSEESLRQGHANRELEAAGVKIQAFETRLAALVQDIEAAKADKARATADLETERRQHEASREEFLHRLEVASEAHLSEFKNRLGNDISRIVSQVPALGSEQPLEMLKVFHVRIHDVLNALRAAGVTISR